jgi:galactokinase
MTGGGFGGCAIALVPGEAEETVASSVAEAFRERGWRAPAFLRGDAAGPAARVA